MSDELSEEELTRYQAAIKEFKEKRIGIEGEIMLLEGEIRDLREQLENMRPVVPGATGICKKCEAVSLKHIRTIPGTSRPDLDNPLREEYAQGEEYICLICKEPYRDSLL